MGSRPFPAAEVILGPFGCATDVTQKAHGITKAQVGEPGSCGARIPDKDDIHEFKPACVILRALCPKDDPFRDGKGDET